MVRTQLRRRAQKDLASDDLSARLVTILDPYGAASEDYRSLRTSLMYALVDTPPKAIVVTSPGPGEGKTTTCANLAVALAQAGKRTLIIECDLRRPLMHKVFSLLNLYGMVNVLVGEKEMEEVSREALENLEVITSGPIPPNPAELLSSRRFAELLEQARQRYDYVLLDTPPTEMVSDSAVIASHSDGVLLVIDAQGTRKGSVRRAVHSLETVGANVLGTVMNNVSVSRSSHYYYSYKGYHSGSAG